MAVVIRMKKMGRAHRHFFRICATDKRAPRDGRVLEELGTYDPMVPDADARVVLKNERVDHWLSVGALPSEKVAILLKKYGTNGTHVDAQRAAVEKLSMPYTIPDAGEPASKPKADEPAAEEASAEAPAAEEAPAEPAAAE
ncbi:30S ribosomal protein S16 [Botrimarina mediterranea]|uniref:Small ribosomal subunit protein bS16 n=1 Tax=Botrimarina mediterranea TaxID=2528022 RepID=A0A518K4L4_9BACT|nr:30S ribosomal protein S16 [Botrimarina mediterranea]QDV72743.1 30S ribosomal protein S16 [Botrimarina mediterranea]QDV77317.1 30S ribosomal protein S16 [Planctomycetes bacterium K2D]